MQQVQRFVGFVGQNHNYRTLNGGVSNENYNAGVPDSVFQVVLCEVFGACGQCGEVPGTNGCRTSCQHVFCWKCLLAYLLREDRVLVTCPMCRREIHNVEFGVRLPERLDRLQEVPIFHAFGVDGNRIRRLRWVTTLAAADKYVSLPRSRGNGLGNDDDRVMFPLVLAEYNVPVFRGFDFVGWFTQFYGSRPLGLFWQSGAKSCFLPPGIVEALDNFWKVSDVTVENYRLSVLKCSNLCATLAYDQRQIGYIMDTAPLISLFTHSRNVKMAAAVVDKVRVVLVFLSTITAVTAFRNRSIGRYFIQILTRVVLWLKRYLLDELRNAIRQ